MQELVPRHGGLFHTQRQGLHAPGASGRSNWFCNTIVFVQHRFAISHRPARSPIGKTPQPQSHSPIPTGSRSRNLRQPKLPSRIPRKPFTSAKAPEPDPVSCGSQGFPAPDSVSRGSYLRQPVCPPGLPGTGFCIPRQLFAAALHARRGIPTPARQNPLDGPACPPARTFANIANIIRMHERVLSDENAGWGLVRQTSAALVAASLEDLSAVRGSHSLTEAVNLASLSLFRLICSEH